MCSLKIHDNPNECQHDILYNSNVKPINKIHAQSCNKNAIKLKKNKIPERCQRCSGVYLYIKQNFSRHFLLQP